MHGIQIRSVVFVIFPSSKTEAVEDIDKTTVWSVLFSFQEVSIYLILLWLSNRTDSQNIFFMRQIIRGSL